MARTKQIHREKSRPLSSEKRKREETFDIIESITGKKIVRDKLMYQVIWKEYDTDESVWVPAELVTRAYQVVEEFEDKCKFFSPEYTKVEEHDSEKERLIERMRKPAKDERRKVKRMVTMKEAFEDRARRN